MPINEGKEGSAILVFAMPKKPGRGVTPPAMAPAKKPDKPGLPGMDYEEEEDKCEHCEGAGCPECETEVQEEEEGEGMHQKQMGMIGKLISLLEKNKQGE
jgi:hypothetical protein